ncbi:MAG: hypothetical protein JRJ49_00270 [Deltaproteobacteria bacterium]|nr:hypothetical protein [Deltaproteobacteria bacterium]
MKNRSINEERRLIIEGYQPAKGNLDRNNPPGKSSLASLNINQTSGVSQSNPSDKK